MASEGLLNKLEAVERSLNIYDIKTESLVKEIEINIPLERLKTVVVPKNGDSLLYMGYILNAYQVEAFNKDLGGIIKADFDLYYYVLECHGIYNW